MAADVAASAILAIVFLLNAVAWLVQRSKLQEADTAKSLLQREIAVLKAEAAKYNQPSTYAKCAKCQRQINVKEKQLVALEASSVSSNAWGPKVQQGVKVAKAVGATVCFILFYGRPLLHLPASFLTPLQRFLAMPHGSTLSQFGGIAVIPWLLLCDRACSMLLQAVLPPTRRAAPPAKGPSSVSSSAYDKKTA